MNPTWRQWLRACERDKTTPAELPGSLGMLTGTDARALDAIAACWTLYAYNRDQRVLDAVRSLLPSLQQKCWGFARELIAWAMDWNDRYAIWTLVVAPLEPPLARILVEEHRGVLAPLASELLKK